MARFDAEAAWDDLQAKLLEREGWGTKQLMAEMAHLRVLHRIPEEACDRFLRVFGSRLTESVAHMTRASGSSAPGGTPTGERDARLTTADPEEDHDGRWYTDPAAR